jgi:phosphatidylinositol N-acetylglucosaminyltransferase subunit H
MKCIRPLAKTHPELLIVEGRGYREYRVQNSHLARSGSGKIVKGYTSWAWKDAFIVAICALLWPQVRMRLLEFSGIHKMYC